MKAWHFLNDDGKLRGPVNGTIKPGVGQTLKVDPNKLKLCEFGLHASERAIDALRYAPGSVLCRVEMTGKIIEAPDKVVASERTILEMADVSGILHEAACQFAELALNKIKNPDPRSLAAIAAKRAWLRGEITDVELSAARSAAAESAAWSAAWSAESAWAAWSAAAESAESAAAESAAWASSSARSAQNQILLDLLRPLFGDSACDS